MSDNGASCWWIVCVVHKGTGEVIKTDIDAVMATCVSEATKIAQKRNPLRPHESFGVKKASKLQKRRCCAISEERTDEIAKFTELMSD